MRFNDFLWVFTSSKYLKIYTRDQRFIDSFDSLLFANLTISLSIFLFFSYNTFIGPLNFDLLLFLKLMLAVSLFFLIKTMIERLLGSVFGMETLLDQYLFQKITFKNFSGLLILLCNLLLIYSDFNHFYLILSMLFVLGVILLVGFLNSYQMNLNEINRNFFYFLLYLCALEIGPYVLLFKVLKEYNG